MPDSDVESIQAKKIWAFATIKHCFEMGLTNVARQQLKLVAAVEENRVIAAIAEVLAQDGHPAQRGVIRKLKGKRKREKV